MRQSVKPRICRQTRWNIEHQFRITHGKSGHQSIVRKRIFHARLFIRDDGKRSHLAPRPRCCRHRNKYRFFPHFRKPVHPLSNIHKPHRQIFKPRGRMLVQHPHNLRRVHRRAAAHSNHDVRTKRRHTPRPLSCTSKGGIGRNLKKFGMLDTKPVQNLCYTLDFAVFIQKLVRHDERAFTMIIRFQLFKRRRQTPTLKIYLFRRAEPKHILSTLGNRFYVDKLANAHVFANAVASPRAAPKRQRRRQTKIIQIPNTALRRRRIDKDTAGFHTLAKRQKPILLAPFIDIDSRGMPKAAATHQSVRLFQTVLEAFRLVHRQNRGKFFFGKRLVLAHRRNLRNENFTIVKHAKPRHFRYLFGRLTDDFRIQSTRPKQKLPQFFRSCFVHKKATLRRHFSFKFLVNFLRNDHRLLGSANHTVVEGFGVYHGRSRQTNIRTLVNDCGRIACAHPDGRLPR